MQSVTVQSLFVGSFLSYKNCPSRNSKKDVILLGQGWFAKGFMDHIDKKKFYITNITRHTFVNTPLLISENKTENNNNFTKKIDEIIIDDIQEINLDKKIIVTKNNNYLWSDKYLVCGLGSNEDIGNKWIPIIEKILKSTEKKNIV